MVKTIVIVLVYTLTSPEGKTVENLALYDNWDDCRVNERRVENTFKVPASCWDFDEYYQARTR